MGCSISNFFGIGNKPVRQEKQVQYRPAKDPADFKPGIFVDSGILWVQFFRKLLIPQPRADYSKEPCSTSQPECEDILRRCRQAQKARREKCKCGAKCNRGEEVKMVDSDRCKKFREKLKSETDAFDRTQMKDEGSETSVNLPSKCGTRTSTTTVYCEKCNRCTRIIDCTGHKND